MLTDREPLDEVVIAETVDAPETINDAGRAAIALLKRWLAYAAADKEATATLLAIWGTQSSIGRMALRPLPPVHEWLTDLAYENGARLADMGGGLPAPSMAAKEMLRYDHNSPLIKDQPRKWRKHLCEEQKRNIAR